MTYSLSVFIGRFEPFHQGHAHVVTEALGHAKRVLILIGSAHEPRSLRNPFSFDERREMILSCFSVADQKRIICAPLLDVRYNDTLWVAQVQRAVYAHEEDDAQITLIGRKGKGNGYYTNLFPQWAHTQTESISVKPGTDIRTHLFENGTVDSVTDDLPPPVVPYISAFLKSADGADLMKEYAFVEKYKKGWENTPFPPTHVTVDAVVVQSAHVLLVRRGAYPGKGLYALPGGFIHAEETLVNAMVRKLKDETQIKVPVPALMGSIKSQSTFDAPFRSVRGRTITHAFYVELRSEEQLPKIKSSGENDGCFWVPLGTLNPAEMYEDHYFIIQKMIGMM